MTNRLTIECLCVTRDYNEYLMIHRLMELHGIPLLHSYSTRISMGTERYLEYPNLYWNGEKISGTASHGSHRYKQILNADEFLLMAGITTKYVSGGPIKHIFL